MREIIVLEVSKDEALAVLRVLEEYGWWHGEVPEDGTQYTLHDPIESLVEWVERRDSESIALSADTEGKCIIGWRIPPDSSDEGPDTHYRHGTVAELLYPYSYNNG